MTKPRVLVVEDEPLLSKALRLNLEHRGYLVKTADSISTALPLVDSFRPAAVLVDGGLGEDSGVALVAWIRSHPDHRNVKIIAMSGTPQQQALFEAFRHEYHCFLEKPFSTDELVEALKTVLGD